MHDTLDDAGARQLVDDFQNGRLSRRQLIAQLMALGAAAAVTGRALGQQAPATRAAPTFQATQLDHIALRVGDVGRSVAFYREHLGLNGNAGANSAFLSPPEGGFILAVFRGADPGLAHYCYRIRDYDAGGAVEKLEARGLAPRREGNRVYFDDPDGIEVQIEA